ncbi:MAG TPA: hypothetical protein P5114_09050 [Hyphomicrobiaceae bacterium]|jgi:hypothetical protein|nr:hypothetical protein [Hyphomicrobiaceae bacterium]
MAVTQLHNGNSDGVNIGRDANDLLGFFGATPIDQEATIADATDAATAITQLNAVIAALEAYGLLASS